MSHIVQFTPQSQQARWALKVNIAPGVECLKVAFSKIWKTFQSGRTGHESDICELHDWYQAIKKLDGYFAREFERLNRLAQNRFANTTQSPEPFDKHLTSVHLSYDIGNPISASLYQLICHYDQLMLIVEFCRHTNIFKKRRTMGRKNDQYTSALITLLMRICQYQMGKDQSLATVDIVKLADALACSAMPIMPSQVSLRLNSMLRSMADKFGVPISKATEQGEIKTLQNA